MCEVIMQDKAPLIAFLINWKDALKGLLLLRAESMEGHSHQIRKAYTLEF